MQTSDNGRAFIKKKESCVLRAYPDANKPPVWTIGYGYTGPSVKPGLVWSQATAEKQFNNKLAVFEKCINDNVTVDLNQNQFDALVSLVYNIGPGNFESSSILSQLNVGNYEEAANRFSRYNKGGKPLVVIDALTKRRAEEKELFLTPMEDQA